MSTSNPIPILGAVKLTGTNRNGVTVGFLESITAETTSKLIRNGESDIEITEPLTNYTLDRVRKNWEGNTLLGGMVTSVNRKLVRKYLGDTMVENAFTSGVDFKRYFLSMIDLKKLRIQIIALMRIVLECLLQKK